MEFLFFFDRVAKITARKFVYRVAYNAFLVLLAVVTLFLSLRIVLTGSVTSESVSLLHTGIVSTIYGVPGKEIGEDVSAENVLGTGSGGVPQPRIVKKIAFPYLSARAHLAVDNNSGTILSEHNAYRSFAPASVTKLMTALVARDVYVDGDLLVIPPVCTEVESTKLWLPTETEFEFEDLLHALLISSAGDAGCALASNRFEKDIFINLMNRKAEELQMTNTQFTNEIGLDGHNGTHYSSAWDLYLLSREAVKDPLIRNIIKTKEYTFSDAGGEQEFNIVNTNKLLWEIPNTIGVKTGTTSGAGEVLLYQYREGLKDITIVVLSSDERFLDTRNLLNWILNSYQWN